MPMQRHLYPKNWEAIAKAVKEAADWRCQTCLRPCRRPKEVWKDFSARLLKGECPKWFLQTWDDVAHDETGEWISIDRPQRFTLTVAHLDHNPANCDPDNLKALCSGCHLRYDSPMKAAKKRAKSQAKPGQLTLF